MDHSIIKYGAYDAAEAYYLSRIEKTCRKFPFSVGTTTETMKTDANTLDLVVKVITEVTETEVTVVKSKMKLYNDLNWISENLVEADNDSFACLVDVNATSVDFLFMSHDRVKAPQILEKILEKIPVIKPDKDPHIVPFNFWNIDTTGVHHMHKNIQCPLYPEIKDNYPSDVMEAMNYLGNLETPDSIGKIIIFSGPPGTGKTTAVRALAREWAYKLGASAEIFLDPEELLASSGYLNKVLLDVDSRIRVNKVEHPEDTIPRAGTDPFEDEDDDDNPTKPEHLRLVIIEDCADLIAVNCRDKIGFSRFLNVTDGIIGQGLRHVFLLTANEDLGRLDPAVTRRGRCIKTVEFSLFDKSEGKEWLRNHGAASATDEVEGDIPLSDLYAIKAGIGAEEVKAKPKIGF